uniref:Uncharacterized protein n=1 Tax=Anguilla anguilla TaxID=7936 RepID=A0A0E9RDL6_ANGAN
MFILIKHNYSDESTLQNTMSKTTADVSIEDK